MGQIMAWRSATADPGELLVSPDHPYAKAIVMYCFLLLLCVLTSWALDKRKVVKPAPTAALRAHHCQGREHPSVRETWCVSESETPPRGGRDAVGRIRRVCVQSCSIFFIRVHLLYICVFYFSHFSSFLSSY